ncbi:hypothetical protein C0991_005344 [Blastosporella zonata]|nr:hypothetical protein C0991_005344 [Blastosporella zonata]
MLSPSIPINNTPSTLSVNGTATIAPWDEPPTPPPKHPNGRSGFSFPSKASFSTFSTFRSGSSATLLRPRTSDSHSTLSTSEGGGQRLSIEEAESRQRFNSTSSSSTLDAPLRKSKSSILSKLRSRSKSRLRADSGEGEHPSLQKPPPIPDAHNTLLAIRAPIITKKKPPADYDPAGLHNVLDWRVDDLIADGIIGAGGIPAPHPSTLDSAPLISPPPVPHPSSPSASSTDHDFYTSMLPGFSNPFLSSHTSRRSARIYNRDSKRISPKDRAEWTAPESWGVEGNNDEGDYESSVDEDSNVPEAPMSFAVPQQVLPLKKHRRPKRRVTPYTVRIYKDDDHFHEATMALSTTVAELIPLLNEKLFIPKHDSYRLYVRERGKERLLGMTEKPANLIKRRLECHGYEANDGVILLLSNMSLKSVPKSVRHALPLRRLDLSSNRIGSLEEASLDRNISLQALYLQNNRIEALPWYFPRLRTLTVLNISNNKFRDVPMVITQLESLSDLDLSFNMLSSLPEELGRLQKLQRLIVVGNQIATLPEEMRSLGQLRKLDVRRNGITGLKSVLGLPGLEVLLADHNAVQGVDLSGLGRNMITLDASYNEITQLSLPEPEPEHEHESESDAAVNTHHHNHNHNHNHNHPEIGIAITTPTHTYALTLLNISHTNLTTLSTLSLASLPHLRLLNLSHNSIRAIPESLGALALLETLQCNDNKLLALPRSIGRLGNLRRLEAHCNEITEVPAEIWGCGRLERINVTSNFLGVWGEAEGWGGGVAATGEWGEGEGGEGEWRKASAGSIGSVGNVGEGRVYPPLVYSLKRLYLGENRLTDDVLHPIMQLKELRVLNLSFNELQDLPRRFFARLELLEEVYLSGNKIASIPTEDLERLGGLRTLYLNGNRLYTLPQELQRLKSLTSLDVGSNQLKYNTNNWEFDWNWNFNKSLKYLNLSGNNRLQIKVEKRQTYYGHGVAKHPNAPSANMSSFTDLTHLRVLGLMDVTLPTVASRNGAADTPDENDDRRVRTSPSTILKMSYGIADALGKNDTLNMLDLMNRSLIMALRKPPKDPRKNSIVTIDKEFRFSPPVDTATTESGASGIVVYFKEGANTMYVANAGDALAVVSRQGVAQAVSHRHDPFDRSETARIRTAEGWVSPSGLVNGMVDVSRSFGFYQYMPAVNARPDVFTYHLTAKDEFVIIADKSLWDFMSYQTAVDIARTERGDPMIAAQKLRDFAISYGAEGSTMIMVIGLAEAPETEGPKKKNQILDRSIARLDGEVPAPVGHIALVFSDIRNSTHLWEANPGMATAHKMHNTLLRRLLRFCGGYEVKTEGDAFMCAFQSSLSAVWWCLSVQSELLRVQWPLEILECEDGKPIYDTSGNLIARGVSIRMGIHCGTPSPEPDPITKRMDYFGSMVNRSARICGNAGGGEIMCSAEILREINYSIFCSGRETEYSKLQPPQAIDEIRQMGVHIVDVGEVKLKGLEVPENISLLYPSHLAGRQNWGPEGATVSGSRVQFSVEQMKELGLICLRLETLTTSRIFKVVPERKGSLQTLNLENEVAERGSSLKLYGDPNVLLPPMNAQSTDAELMALLDSLATRIVNAISMLEKNCAPGNQVSVNKDTIMSALTQRGELDERTLDHILSVLNSI